ncbi:MAG: choice-of-anchor J domain-containing protein, partial [Chitinophagaceae bacterium]
TSWKVDYGFGASPTEYFTPGTVTGDLTLGGTTFENNKITADFGAFLDDKNDVITIRVVALTGSVGGGSRPSSAIDDFKLTWSDANSMSPSIIVNNNNPVSLSFPATAINTNSANLSYTVRAENLTEPLTITSTGAFLVSTAAASGFSPVISVPVADLATDKTIYVRYAPAVAEASVGVVSNASTGATTRTISAQGQGFDPMNLDFTFNSCSGTGAPGSGFSTVSVRGAQNWACSIFGNPHNGTTTNAVDINGYSGSALDNEDWLISPVINAASIDRPFLSFYSRGEFTGPSLQLLISTTYNGSGVIDPAQWTAVPATFAPLSNSWTFTDSIDLSAYKSSNFYIAFKYLSSPSLGAARWTLDDIRVYDPAFNLSSSVNLVAFPETSSGTSSASTPFVFRGLGYGDLTLTSSPGFQLSLNNTSFSQMLNIPSTQAAAGPTLYLRFAPSSKQLKISGSLKAKGTGIDSTLIILSGSSYPKSETLDVGAYNMSFFGSNANNNATPQQVNTQVNNLAIVYQKLNLDIVGVEEVSNDEALAQLMTKLPGYSSVLSPRWSYSFNPPDPNFPAQKIGFVYNAAVATLVSSRAMFEGLYDSVRLGLSHRITGYPTGTPSSFWSSGRLPFMAVFNININGQQKLLRVIDIHAKSADDAVSYSRRVFDVKMLKDSLDAYYPNDNIILVGDYNDRLAGSIAVGNTSPYMGFINDASNYTGLTYPLDVAGRVSFITGTGLIDHIIISNELKNLSIPMSTDIEDPRSYIAGYGASTASDHFPIYTRFDLGLAESPLPVQLLSFDAALSGSQVVLSWVTASEKSSEKFIVERAADGKNFTAIDQQAARTISNSRVSYRSVDQSPLSPIGYYRLKQVDIDGTFTYSKIITLSTSADGKGALELYPNPVHNMIKLSLKFSSGTYSGIITGTNGQLYLQERGTINDLNQKLNQKLDSLKPGVYLFQLRGQSELHSVRFIKQ